MRVGRGTITLVAAVIALATAAPTPRALLINLPRNPERFRDAKQQLDAAGVTFERAEAVDGKMLSQQELNENVTMLGRWLMTRGMIGCFLSHRQCWQRCADAANGPILGAATCDSDPMACAWPLFRAATRARTV